MTALINETVMLFAAARQQLDSDQLTYEKAQQMNNENTNVLEHAVAEDLANSTFVNTIAHEIADQQSVQPVQPAAVMASIATPEAAGTLYAAGKTVIEVSRELGVTYAKATKLIKTSGTTIRNASDRLKGRTRGSKKSISA